MSSSSRKTFIVTCPDCSGRLEIDAATGAVVDHQPAAGTRSSRDFDELLSGIDEDRRRAERIFDQERAAYDDRERLLEERYEEALDRVEEADDGRPPPSPFDLD